MNKRCFRKKIRKRHLQIFTEPTFFAIELLENYRIFLKNLTKLIITAVR